MLLVIVARPTHNNVKYQLQERARSSVYKSHGIIVKFTGSYALQIYHLDFFYPYLVCLDSMGCGKIVVKYLVEVCVNNLRNND